MASDLITIEKPKPPSVVAQLAPLVSTAREFQVRDLESNTVALERCKALREGQKSIEEYFEPARKAADAAKKEILAARDGLIGPIAEARSVYDAKAREYETAERQRAEAEALRLRELARKQDEERRLLEAIAAEEQGDKQAAAAILDEAPDPPVVIVQPELARVAGLSSRTIWYAEVTNLHELVKYVAAHPEWLSLLEAAMPNLNRLAVAQRQALSVPGVTARCRQSAR